MWVQYYGDGISEVLTILFASGVLVKTVSAPFSCSSIESNKYFLTHTF